MTEYQATITILNDFQLVDRGHNSILFYQSSAAENSIYKKIPEAKLIAICESHEQGEKAVLDGATDFILEASISKGSVSKCVLVAERLIKYSNEKVQLEDEVFLSGKRYQALADITSAGLWEHDLQTEKVRWSDSLYRVLGASKVEDISPCPIIDLAHPDDRAELKAQLKERLNSGLPFMSEFRIRKKNDEYIWVRSETYGIKDGLGILTMLIGAIKNIDERKKAEIDLQIRKNQIENIVNGVNGILSRHVSYPDGRFETIYISSGTKSLWETEVFQAVSSSESTAIKLKDSEKERLKNAFLRSARDNAKLDLVYSVSKKNGEQSWLRIVAIPTKLDGGKTEWYSITTDVTTLKKLERAAREQKEMFHNIIDNLDGVVSRHRILPDGKDELVFISKGYEKISGIGVADVMKKPSLYWDQIVEEDRQKVIASVTESIERLLPWQQTWRMLDKEGEQKWIQGSGTPSKQEDGTILLDTVTTDITRLKDITHELATAKQEFRLAAEAGQLGLWKFDPINNLLEWDDLMFKIFGIDPKDFSGKREEWVNALHPEDRTKSVNALTDAINNAADLELQFRIIKQDTKEVRHIRASANVILDNYGEAKLLIGLNWDVTHIIKAQEKITESNNRYALASKASQDAIWDLNLKTNTLRWSQSFASLFKHKIDPNKDQFKEWAKLVHPDDYKRVVVGLEKFIQGNQNKWEEQYRFKKGDSSYAYVIDRGFIVRDYSGKATRMVGTMRDITSNMEFLNAIKEQNEQLKSIAWTQSHELRGPLTRVIGLIELVEQDGFKDISLEEFLSYLNSAAMELDQVIKEIVEASTEIDIYTKEVQKDYR